MASLQLQPPATMENLPRDVLSEIFIRLLAKKLAQMRCVSKSWNALLSSSTFVKSHLHRSLHNNNDKIISFFSESNGNFPEAIVSAHSSRSPNLELTDFIKIPIIGSINGLICYKSYSVSALHIWNPSISSFLTLPPCSPHHQNKTLTHFRFGFDPKTDDYKVLKLASCMDIRSDFKELQVEVYSMRKGFWKLITQSRFPSHITCFVRDDEVCSDGYFGHLHWLCCLDNSGKQQVIVAFDLGEETFSEMHLPDFKEDYKQRVNVLGVLAGKLCVMSSVEDGECEVWVMDEYGVAESWVKHHAFSQFSGYIFPFGFTLHSEFVLDASIGRLGLYDPIADKVKIFKLSGSRSYGELKVVDYVDSLVWVTPS